MVGKVVNRVPRLLKERGETPQDLMFGARLSANTASSWAIEDRQPTRIDLETLASICSYLKVSVGDILEYVPEE